MKSLNLHIKQNEYVIIRAAEEADFPAICTIYAHYVTHTTASLEESPPSVEEILRRWKNSTEKALPYVVAELDKCIVGYAYALPYRPRSAYRYTIEESVYVSEDHQGRGIGYRLLGELITQCRQKGYKQMLAVIAGADNLASITFHKKHGFKQSGVLEKFGFKFNKWIDTILVQKEL